MYPFKTNLLATTVVPFALVVAGGMTTAAVSNILVSKPAMSASAPCNPCAAKNPCNPCNPCAGGAQAGAADCIVPSFARSNANPCNPCAAANPCNPCAAGATAKLTDAQAAKAYDCVVDQMRSAYRKSGNATAASYSGWRRYSRVAYQSATHGGRYVQNYANPTARAYGAFENSGKMPVGSVLAKDSFTITGKGRVSVGPLFLMEKMSSGFNAESGNWKYTMIMPNGSTFGETNGRNSSGMQFCIECHAAVAEEQDHMMFMPEEYRSQ